ncbi:RNA polymerase sigma factor [Verrucomicrobiota bacterium]
MNDWCLLDQYVNEGSETAFGELVQRHTPMVYSCALRRAGAVYADDITQAVFMVLARKAPRLYKRKAKSLAGWLFRTTRYAASEAVRGHKRRREREQIAAENQKMITTEQKESNTWREIMPLLDPALDCLSSKDREIILLRFCQEASFAQVGETLGISENTATKRVSRALDKMKRFFARKGIVLSLPALSAFLVSRSAEAASAELITSCTTAVLVGTNAAGTCAEAALIAKGAIKAMLMYQLKMAAITSCAILTVGAGSIAALSNFNKEEIFRLEKIEPFALEYKARNKLPNGSLEFQINTRNNEKTYFVEMGDEFDGFKVVKHEFKSEKKFIRGVGDREKSDVSELTLQRGRQKIVLIVDKYTEDKKYIAHLVSVTDDKKNRVWEDDILEVQGSKFKVVAIDPEQDRVVLRCLQDGKDMTILARTLHDEDSCNVPALKAD